jgi:predicted enzyme related to lactoylglutathione lyase
MNRVVHFEIHAKNLDLVQKFYQTVFGWDIKDMGPSMGSYRLITTGTDAGQEKWPGINGGLTPRQGEAPKGGEPVNAFVCTISVENVDTSIEKVKQAGGSIALDKMDVPGVGHLVYCLDPEQNIFGMLQPHM